MKPALAIHGLIRRALIAEGAAAEAAADAGAGAAGADDRRVLAATRAMAAEIIAQEANAIRLKALLDAARDQAANRDIRSAEERFAAARDEWEAVRQGILSEPDPYADGIEGPAMPAEEPEAAREPDAVVRRNWLLLGGLPLLVALGIVFGALYLPLGDAAQVAGPHPHASAEPATPVATQAREPTADPKAQSPAGRNAPVKAAVAAKPKLILVPPPPPSRPDREDMATGAPAILDRSGIIRRVE